MISFIGDVFLDKKYILEFEIDNYIFNMEHPLSIKGIPAKNKVNLGIDKSFIKETFKKFPLAVNLANNHIMDYGEISYQETINILEKNKIKYFGSGNMENNFNNPAVVEINNNKIILLGYCCKSTHPIFSSNINSGVAPLDLELIKKDILEHKKSNQFIVINLHWGDEEISYPKPIDIEKARKIIDMGADLIIGHHAHVIQSIEIYNNKKIFYGIGNFIFPNINVNSMFNEIKFTKKYKKIQNHKNKKSIIVTVDNNENIGYKTTYFNHESVILKKTTIPTWLPKNEKNYIRYYKIWSRIRMMELYFKNPRIPTLIQIKLFLGLIK